MRAVRARAVRRGDRRHGGGQVRRDGTGAGRGGRHRRGTRQRLVRPPEHARDVRGACAAGRARPRAGRAGGAAPGGARGLRADLRRPRAVAVAGRPAGRRRRTGDDAGLGAVPAHRDRRRPHRGGAGDRRRQPARRDPAGAGALAAAVVGRLLRGRRRSALQGVGGHAQHHRRPSHHRHRRELVPGRRRQVRAAAGQLGRHLPARAQHRPDDHRRARPDRAGRVDLAGGGTRAGADRRVPGRAHRPRPAGGAGGRLHRAGAAGHGRLHASLRRHRRAGVRAVRLRRRARAARGRAATRSAEPAARP